MRSTRTEIYLDGAAGTPLDPAVARVMAEVAQQGLGNPAALHRSGIAAARVVEKTRAILAGQLGILEEELVFTSGGTEANNLALLGTLLGESGGHLVISAVEHPSVYEPARFLADRGITLTVLPVSAKGRVDPDAVAAALCPETKLVSVMHANNETGAIQPVAAIGAICRERGVPFHVDACQSFGKVLVDPVAWGADLVSLNAHKLHGPRGIGALVVRGSHTLVPLLRGGGHERGLRSGTPNVEGIAGFGEAVARSTQEAAAHGAARYEVLRQKLAEAIPGCQWNSPEDGLRTILNVGFPGCSGKALARHLDRAGIAVATGSACHAGVDRPSRVLLAQGRSDEEARSALRFGLHRFTTNAELDATVAVLVEGVEQVREGA